MKQALKLSLLIAIVTVVAVSCGLPEVAAPIPVVIPEATPVVEVITPAPATITEVTPVVEVKVPDKFERLDALTNDVVQGFARLEAIQQGK